MKRRSTHKAEGETHLELLVALSVLDKVPAKVVEEGVDALSHVVEEVRDGPGLEGVDDAVLLLLDGEGAVAVERHGADAEVGPAEVHGEEGAPLGPVRQAGDEGGDHGHVRALDPQAVGVELAEVLGELIQLGRREGELLLERRQRGRERGALQPLLLLLLVLCLCHVELEGGEGEASGQTAVVPGGEGKVGQWEGEQCTEQEEEGRRDWSAAAAAAAATGRGRGRAGA